MHEEAPDQLCPRKANKSSKPKGPKPLHNYAKSSTVARLNVKLSNKQPNRRCGIKISKKPKVFTTGQYIKVPTTSSKPACILAICFKPGYGLGKFQNIAAKNRFYRRQLRGGRVSICCTVHGLFLNLTQPVKKLSKEQWRNLRKKTFKKLKVS